MELWAIARYDLGLSSREFWELSWDQFEALLARYKLSLERSDYHAALICAVLANIHRSKDSKVFRPQDFMPGKTQTPDDMLEKVKMYQNYFEVTDG
jgi:hypothetical protein